MKYFTVQNNSSFAISANNEVYVWGDFVLKDGRGSSIKTLNFLQMPPVKFSGLRNIRITSLSCNRIVALFLSEDGTVYSYGDDSKSKLGLLGLGPVLTQLKPTPVRTLFDHRVQSVHTGHSHACALTSSGLLFSWGTGTKGQLGINGMSKAEVPTRVKTELKFTKAVCSYNYTALVSCTL